MSTSYSTRICTWFVNDDADQATFSPQTGKMTNNIKGQAVYWRCICLFYASSLVQNPECDHVFYTNADLPVIDGLDIAAFFAELNVTVVLLSITYRHPNQKNRIWGNQFYVMDILREISNSDLPDQTRNLILDSDCIWTRSVAPLSEAISRHGVLTYDVKYLDPDQIINGVSERQLGRFVSSVEGRNIEVVRYCGGEIIAGTKQALAQIFATTQRYWDVLEKRGDNVCQPQEEAHLLSCAYAAEDIPLGTADPFIRRLWNARKFNNLQDSDLDLMIWHLPAQKTTGFLQAFGLMRKSAGPGRPTGCVADFSTRDWARIMGVPRSTLAKRLRDWVFKILHKTALR